MTATVAIAISGGVDSLVAAHLIQQQTNDLFGVHFLTGYEKDAAAQSAGVAALCRQRGLPLHTIDLSASFTTLVVDYFARAYDSGETPNPCLVCNPAIKFGLLMETVRRLGATRLATGHYARVQAGPDGRRRLRQGVDPSKDQSYFLSRLTQNQLARAVLPLGTWTKAQVKALAAAQGLQPISRQESQDVCFIGNQTYSDFLVEQAHVFSRPGKIVDTEGRAVGRHNGLHRYTIGQRRGINCPAAEPYYVVALDQGRNRLIVGHRRELARRRGTVTDINWINRPEHFPAEVAIQIRYRHRSAPARLTETSPTAAEFEFETAQNAITPGQGAVFYRGDEVLGGGWIA